MDQTGLLLGQSEEFVLNFSGQRSKELTFLCYNKQLESPLAYYSFAEESQNTIQFLQTRF